MVGADFGAEAAEDETRAEDVEVLGFGERVVREDRLEDALGVGQIDVARRVVFAGIRGIGRMVAETIYKVRVVGAVVDNVRADERVCVADAELGCRTEAVVLQGERGRGRTAQKRQSGKRGDGEERFFTDTRKLRAACYVKRRGGG